MFGAPRKLFTGGKFSSRAMFVLDESHTREIRGIFDDAFYDSNLGENVVEGSTPRLTCSIEDTVGIEREMVATINGLQYSVLEVQPNRAIGLAVITFAHEEAE